MTNFFTGQDAGFEGGRGHWTSGNNTTVADTSAAAHTGIDSLSLTATASGTVQAVSCNAGNITTQGMPVNPGDTVFVASWFLAATTGRTCRVSIGFYNSSGTQVGVNTAANTGTDTTGTWTQVQGTLTAPDGVAFCRAVISVVSLGASEVHYIDDVIMGRTASSIPIMGFLLDLFGERLAA